MPNMTRLDHVAIYVRDPVHLAGFYRDFFGMREVGRLPDQSIVFLTGPTRPDGVDLELIRRPAGAGEQDETGRSGDHTISTPHVAFTVGTLADLLECHRDVASHGGSSFAGMNHGVALSCHILDPEGHHVQVAWLTGQPMGRPMAAPIDLDLSEDEVLDLLAVPAV